jgi:Kef-type K+ transport system membrane component KefB
MLESRPLSRPDLVLFLLQIAVMLAVARLGGWLMRRIRQPAVLGELLGGIVLGPTVFSRLVPGAYAWLFPNEGVVALARDTLITFGMLFFLFEAGLEVNLAMVRRLRWRIAWTSVAGIALPFALGCGLVLFWPGPWGPGAQSHASTFALFVGAALSISALPVIARILMDLDLLTKDLGVVVISAATVNDLIGWSLFAIVLSTFVPNGLHSRGMGATLALTVGFYVLVLGIGRWVVRRAASWVQDHPSQRGIVTETVLVPVLLASAAAEFIGVHAFLGAFLVGVAASENLPERDPACVGGQSQFALRFFAPIYFVSVGLKADFAVHFDLLLVSIVFVVATVGKVCGGVIGARLGGMPLREAWATGFAMNARGAMEIILASVALQHGLIDQRVFVALFTMAVVTSMLSGPVIQRLVRVKPSYDT